MLLLLSCFLVDMDDCAEAKVAQTRIQFVLTVGEAIAVLCPLIIEVCRGLHSVILLKMHRC